MRSEGFSTRRRRSLPRLATRWLLLTLLACSVVARADENYLNPGTMGPNALPPATCESPWIGDGWVAEVGLGLQNALGPPAIADSNVVTMGQRSYDQSATLPFHAEYRFARRAALMVEGTPTEVWLLSGVTQEAWSTPNPYGISKGDIRIGGKFLVFEGRSFLPAFAIRAWTKTTTGKSVQDHRFINSPGYQFDALFGGHLPIRPGFALELWAAAGFLAWQQAQFGQNDAVAWSATLSALWDTGTALRLQYQGYRGWVRDDQPHSAGLVLELPLARPEGALPPVTALVGATQSFRDPVYTGFRIGLRVGAVAESPPANSP